MWNAIKNSGRILKKISLSSFRINIPIFLMKYFPENWQVWKEKSLDFPSNTNPHIRSKMDFFLLLSHETKFFLPRFPSVKGNKLAKHEKIGMIRRRQRFSCTFHTCAELLDKKVDKIYIPTLYILKLLIIVSWQFSEKREILLRPFKKKIGLRKKRYLHHQKYSV